VEGSTKQLSIALGVTILDTTVALRYGAVIWRVWSPDVWVSRALIGIALIAIGSLVDIWSHALYACQCALRGRGVHFSTAASSEFTEGADV
jgi:hypothetical protein